MGSQLSAIEFGNVGVVAKDDDPRAVGGEFFYFRGDDDERHALLAQALDEPDDFRMRPDVDAARRLVEDEQFRFGREPARQDGLLLIAAGKQPDRFLAIRRADIECPDVVVREPVLLRARNRAGPAAPCLKGEHDILAHGQVADDAGGLAVLGAEAELLPDCGTRRGKIDGPAIDLGRTAIGAMGAEEDFGGFRPP